MKITITDAEYEDKYFVATEIMRRLNTDFDVTVFDKYREKMRISHAEAKGYIDIYVE